MFVQLLSPQPAVNRKKYCSMIFWVSLRTASVIVVSLSCVAFFGLLHSHDLTLSSQLLASIGLTVCDDVVASFESSVTCDSSKSVELGLVHLGSVESIWLVVASLFGNFSFDDDSSFDL